jgi:hypothetical protein
MPSCALGVGVNRKSRSPRLAVNSHKVRTATEYGIVKWYSIKAGSRLSSHAPAPLDVERRLFQWLSGWARFTRRGSRGAGHETLMNLAIEGTPFPSSTNSM